MSTVAKRRTTRTAADGSATVPPGYKRTAVGVIPEDWQTKQLGEHVTYLRNGTNSRAELMDDGRTKYLHYGDIHTSANVRLNPLFHEMPSLPEGRARTLDRLQDGDLVFVDASEDLDGVGKSIEITGAANTEIVSGLHTIAARFDKAILVDGFKAYLQFCPAFRHHLRRLAAGTKVYSTSRNHISSTVVPLPPPPEQRAIAKALSDVDGLLEALEALIAKKRAIKQGAMQQLLTGKTRLPGFSGEWETKRLREVLTVRHGRNQADIIVEDGQYPILASGGEIGRTNTPLYDRPSVLIGRKGTIDDPQMASTPFWTVDTLFYTEITIGCSAKFLYYLFCMIPWRNYNEASGVPSLNARTIESITVQLPEFHEQVAIANSLSDMDAAIAALEGRRDKTRAIKQGMMQQLLTGRVRLVKAEKPE